MPMFEIELYELVANTYRIEADDLASAIAGVQEGRGSVVAEQTERLGLCEERGVSLDELHLTRFQAEQANAVLDDNVFVGLRWAREVGGDGK